MKKNLRRVEKLKHDDKGRTCDADVLVSLKKICTFFENSTCIFATPCRFDTAIPREKQI